MNVVVHFEVIAMPVTSAAEISDSAPSYLGKRQSMFTDDIHISYVRVRARGIRTVAMCILDLDAQRFARPP
ncbi:hypothetical protein AOQ73_01690 [Bradyrhizobium pachyrhizi]|nr:hypothetical protein AOQ73_01690 [Bradyrhizobium pachyrhizi]